ncbi:prepilin-type N-terminal cleavage/methylation domain-containing protein [Providencia rettgeri]
MEEKAMKQKQSHTQDGFTLIEILSVLFICSLTTLSGMHQWKQHLEKQRLIDAARQLSEFIYSHMMEGVYLNRHQLLSIKIGKEGWGISVKDANTRQEIGKITADKYQGIELIRASRHSVDLYGKQGTSRAFSFELRNKDTDISIYISALGRIRACSKKNIVGLPKC